MSLGKKLDYKINGNNIYIAAHTLSSSNKFEALYYKQKTDLINGDKYIDNKGQSRIISSNNYGGDTNFRNAVKYGTSTAGGQPDLFLDGGFSYIFYLENNSLKEISQLGTVYTYDFPVDEVKIWVWIVAPGGNGSASGGAGGGGAAAIFPITISKYTSYQINIRNSENASCVKVGGASSAQIAILEKGGDANGKDGGIGGSVIKSPSLGLSAYGSKGGNAGEHGWNSYPVDGTELKFDYMSFSNNTMLSYPGGENTGSLGGGGAAFFPGCRGGNAVTSSPSGDDIPLNGGGGAGGIHNNNGAMGAAAIWYL